MPTLYAQYILPLIPVSGGFVEIRINTNGKERYNILGTNRDGTVESSTPGTRRFTFDARQFIKDETEIEFSEALSDEAGITLSDSIEFEILDPLLITGVDDTDAPVSINYAAVKSTFANHIFSDRSKKYPCFVTFINYAGDKEPFFGGNIDPNNLTFSPFHTRNPGTANEIHLQSVKIRVHSWTEKLDAKITDLRARIDESKMTAGSGKPFYGGFVREGHFGNSNYDAEFKTPLTAAEITTGVLSALWDERNDVAFYGAFTDLYSGAQLVNEWDFATGLPRGMWGIKLATLVKEVCELADCDFDPDADFESAFEFTVGQWNAAVNQYEDVVIDAKDLEIVYNYAFGFSPIDGSAFDSPITYPSDTTVRGFLQGIAYLLGAHVWPELEQDDTSPSYGYTRLRLLSRRRSGGTLPTSWQLLESKEDASTQSKDCVEVSNHAHTTVVRIPSVESTDSIKIEIPFRTRAFGRNAAPAFDIPKFVVNNKRPYHEQWVHWKVNAQDGGVNPDGWVAGAYLYYYDPSSSNKYYPLNISTYYTDIVGWSGYYMVRCCAEKAGEYGYRDNTLYGPAQFYAREMLGTRRQTMRRYKGILGNDGKLRSVRVNVESTFAIAGVTETRRAISIRRFLRSGETEITFQSKPDYSTLPDLSAKWLDGENSTGGSASNGSNTGGGANIETQPGTSFSNKPIVAKKVVYDFANIDTAYTEVTLQLVVNDGDPTKNGLWSVPVTGTMARPNIPIFYGQQVVAQESQAGGTNGIFGKNSLWYLKEPNTQHPRPIENTENQQWQRVNALEVLDIDGATWSNPLARGLSVVSGDGSITANWNSAATVDGEYVPALDLIVNFPPNPCHVVARYSCSGGALTINTGGAAKFVIPFNVLDYALPGVGWSARWLNTVAANGLITPNIAGWYAIEKVLFFGLQANTPAAAGDLELQLLHTTTAGLVVPMLHVHPFNNATTVRVERHGTDTLLFNGSTETLEAAILNYGPSAITFTGWNAEIRLRWVATPDCIDAAPP